MEPPVIIKLKLNLKLKESIVNKEIDLSNLEISELTTLASNFKDEGAPENSSFKDMAALEISVFIIEELILTKNPEDSAALSVLCSLLRKVNKPKEALEKTKSYKYQNAALFTSRAAAMCDLELWEEAHNEVARAIAMVSDIKDKQEGFNVVKRIKEVRLDLYK